MEQKTTENTQENNVFVGEMLLKGKGMLNIAFSLRFPKRRNTWKILC